MFTDAQYTCLVNKYIDMVYRIALNYLGNNADAEDVCQNVFLKLLTERKPFLDELHIRNWLVRVCINECKRVLRSPWHKRESLEDHPHKFIFAREQHSELFYEVMDLPAHYRIPLYLYYYEGYSTQEISQLLTLPKATVCTRLSRARQLLRGRLEEAEENV